jgi:tRNA(Ile)-lysidine synthase
LGVLEQFLIHINAHRLCKTTDKILLAVSGGVDSMVMLRLFVDAGYKPAVAHCNFMLRGDASLADEQLVKTQCENQQTPFYTTRFDTSRIATERGTSVQVTARDLRYNFFRQICEQHGYNKIATAHNANDNLETVLLNLLRGTGIDGIDGIPVSADNIIRPLLFASRSTIHDFAIASHVTWREDASNFDDDYTRNYLRHHVVPHLQTLNPNLETTFSNSVDRISAGVKLAKTAMQEIFSRYVTKESSSILIDRKILSETESAAVLLWEYLKVFGFNFPTCRLMIDHHQVGRKFFSGTKVLTVDREAFVIEDAAESEAGDVLIEYEQEHAVMHDQHLSFSVVEKKQFLMDSDSKFAHLDSSRLKYPLTWRRWRAGDSFVPLGMSSPKKVSDFLTDIKYPSSRKADVTVLQSGEDIVWIVGHRIHEHYKVSQSTRHILTIHFQQHKK